ncbi:hypothetical protein KIPB_011906, partial [Kipferlia bialata]
LGVSAQPPSTIAKLTQSRETGKERKRELEWRARIDTCFANKEPVLSLSGMEDKLAGNDFMEVVSYVSSASSDPSKSLDHVTHLNLEGCEIGSTYINRLKTLLEYMPN